MHHNIPFYFWVGLLKMQIGLSFFMPFPAWVWIVLRDLIGTGWCTIGSLICMLALWCQLKKRWEAARSALGPGICFKYWFYRRPPLESWSQNCKVRTRPAPLSILSVCCWAWIPLSSTAALAESALCRHSLAGRDNVERGLFLEYGFWFWPWWPCSGYSAFVYACVPQKKTGNGHPGCGNSQV